MFGEEIGTCGRIVTELRRCRSDCEDYDWIATGLRRDCGGPESSHDGDQDQNGRTRNSRVGGRVEWDWKVSFERVEAGVRLGLTRSREDYDMGD